MDHIIYRDYIANRRSFIYCSLTRALLAPYCLTSETYRRKLRTAKRKDEEAFVRCFAPSETFHVRWLELSAKERSFEGFVHRLLQKQLIGKVIRNQQAKTHKTKFLPRKAE